LQSIHAKRTKATYRGAAYCVMQPMEFVIPVLLLTVAINKLQPK